MKKIFAAIAIAVVIVSLLTATLIVTEPNKPPTIDGKPSAYVGIAYCGDTVEQGKALIDKVKGYSNLFVLQSGVLQRDLKSVNELGDYAVDAGMYFLPYFGNFIQASLSPWLESAKTRWADHFLGVYYGDEPGGKMLDGYVEYDDAATGGSIIKTTYGDVVVEKPNGVIINYELNGNIRLSEPQSAGGSSDLNSEALFHPDGTIEIIRQAANGFSYQTYQQLAAIKPFKDTNETAQRFYARDKSNINFLHNATTVFTSDYAMHWFDYKAGYDVVLGQVGWNQSINQQISLLRGAANLQHKDWGVVITWKYQTPPYLDSGDEIFKQLKTSNDCGAKYYIIFDYYGENPGPYGSMLDEHFNALKSFWNDVVVNSNVQQGSIVVDSAVVLPKNYGWGARWAEDKVWGIYLADQQTKQLYDLIQSTLNKHGLQTDIVYDDADYPLAESYTNIYELQP